MRVLLLSKGKVTSYCLGHQCARQGRSDGTTTSYAGPMKVEISNGATRVNSCWSLSLGVEIDQLAGATELN